MWCRAGRRPRSVPECHTSPAALRGPCSAPVAGSASLKPPISLEPPRVKPQSQQSLLLQGRTTAGADFHQMLLTRNEGQSPESGFGCGPVAVPATASTGRKTHGRDHRTSHTDTLQGQEEREETTASKRKRTPLLIYTPPPAQHRSQAGCSGSFLLGPVGSPQPNRDVEISHGIPKTEGKHGKTPRWRTWRNRAVPPSLPCIPRPVQKGQRSQGEGIEVLLSWLFCLARTDRRCPPAGLQLQHQRCEQPQVGPAETSPGDRRRSLEAGKLSWEA